MSSTSALPQEAQQEDLSTTSLIFSFAPAIDFLFLAALNKYINAIRQGENVKKWETMPLKEKGMSIIRRCFDGNAVQVQTPSTSKECSSRASNTIDSLALPAYPSTTRKKIAQYAVLVRLVGYRAAGGKGALRGRGLKGTPRYLGPGTAALSSSSALPLLRVASYLTYWLASSLVLSSLMKKWPSSK